MSLSVGDDIETQVRLQVTPMLKFDANAMAQMLLLTDAGTEAATRRTLKAEAEDVATVTCTALKRLLLNAEAETVAAVEY